MRRTVITLGLVWLTAFNLRVILFAIPPTLPAIRAELGLSFSATGTLASVSILVLGVASIPGAWLATRYGARRLVAVCCVGLAVFTFSLTLPPALFWIFFGSGMLTLSIALAQPPLAVLIRRWFPTAITRAGNLYANGILMGNVVGAASAPFMSRALGWRGMFLVWAAVAGVSVLLWVRFTPGDQAEAPRFNLGVVLRDPRAWQIAALFTFQNLVFYTVISWVPFVVNSRGPEYVTTTLLFLIFFPLVPLFALAFVRWPYALSTTFYVIAGGLAVAGSLGLLLGLDDLVRPLVFMVGLGTGAAFVAALTLPPLVAGNESEASTYAAVMYTAGYLLTFVGPITSGMLVDATGRVNTAFWPAVVGAILMTVVGVFAPRLLTRSQTAAAR